eukprot:scaffold9825_cov203-Cylindrotheca_fusiformis.AAC.2
MPESVEDRSKEDPDNKRSHNKHRRRDDDDDNDEKEEKEQRNNDNDDDDQRRKRKRRSKKSRHDDDDDKEDSSSVDSRHRHRRRHRSRRPKSKSSRSHRHKRSKRSSSRKKKRKRSYSSSSSDEASDSDSSSSSSSSSNDNSNKHKVLNEKLLAKLSQRGETLEERKERRAQKRAAKIAARFGYTAEENPFNDPNLHETFNWTKKKKQPLLPETTNVHEDTLEQIETIRRRRKMREEEKDEMDRARAEESRMKELENYDEWAKKEELFHLEQQRKRSAIRLVEGREKPIDILAKNLLLFGLTDEEKNQRAAVKYKERYNAMEQVEKLDAELEEPHKIIKVLKLVELNDLKVDIEAFRILEREGGGQSESSSSILHYWDALYLVTQNEIKFLQNGGEKSDYARKVKSINEIFEGQSRPALMKMKNEVISKLASPNCDDRPYWQSVQEQLNVHFAILDLSEIHKKMLVRQLEKLEQRKEELAKQKENQAAEAKDEAAADSSTTMVPTNVDANFGNAEEELNANDEVELEVNNKSTKTKTYAWEDRYAPRKPRYFNRVKTGYDWNKYNQTHYDSENPPPKIVQGYSFNIFYPDLVDPTKTPQYFVEPADSDDFCILRFRGGAPYEDIAFKIINREWNRSRKRGFKCTFERGILSLYFNFATHWYRR